MKSPREVQAIANILGGVPILGVVPGSAAEHSGLRYGDIVVSLNGVTTDTFEAFLGAHDLTRGGELSVEVFRDGLRLSLTMSVPPRKRENAPADASVC